MKFLEKVSKLLTVLFLLMVFGVIVFIVMDKPISAGFLLVFSLVTLTYILVLGALSIHTIYKEYQVDRKATINKLISKFLTMFIVVTLVGYLINKTVNIKYNIMFGVAMSLMSFYRDAKMKM